MAAADGGRRGQTRHGGGSGDVERIKEAQAKHPDQPVLIAGDKNAKYEAVLNVMDELQRAEVAKIGLLVQQKGNNTR